MKKNKPGIELLCRGATPKVSSPQPRFTIRVRDGIGVEPQRHEHQELINKAKLEKPTYSKVKTLPAGGKPRLSKIFPH